MSAAIGVTTVAGQLLIPLTGDLADDATRGRMVGIVASGLLIGIIASRTVSGIIAGASFTMFWTVLTFQLSSAPVCGSASPGPTKTATVPP